MTINVVMSCSYDSKLLEYWPIVSKMWKNYNFNPASLAPSASDFNLP